MWGYVVWVHVLIEMATYSSVWGIKTCERPLSPQEVKLYEEVTSLEELTGIVEMALEEYNNTHKNRMNLVIFRYTSPLYQHLVFH